MGRLTLSGNICRYIEIISHNFKTLVEHHSHSIEIIFLAIHILLQLILIVLVYLLDEYVRLIISLFIVLFLALISQERIIMNFKSKIAQKEKEKAVNDYYQLRTENEILREKNKDLIEQKTKIIELFKEIIEGKSLKKKR